MLQQAFHIYTGLFPLGLRLAGFCADGSFQIFGKVMDYCCVKACPILFLTLLGKTYIQLDIVVPMAAQVVIRQIGCALLYRFQPGKIGLPSMVS